MRWDGEPLTPLAAHIFAHRRANTGSSAIHIPPSLPPKIIVHCICGWDSPNVEDARWPEYGLYEHARHVDDTRREAGL